MKRGRVAGTISSSRIGSPSEMPLQVEDQREALVRDERERDAPGSIACGVSTGKIWSSEMALEPVRRPRRRSRRCRAPRRRPRASASRRSRPDLLLAGGQRVGLGGDRGELLGRGQAVGRRFLDAEQLLALEAGDADHEEFVEIVARDGEEAQPLEQGMGRVARLLEHAPVEGQPGQLAVEIARPAPPAAASAASLAGVAAAASIQPALRARSIMPGLRPAPAWPAARSSGGDAKASTRSRMSTILHERPHSCVRSAGPDNRPARAARRCRGRRAA